MGRNEYGALKWVNLRLQLRNLESTSSISARPMRTLSNLNRLAGSSAPNVNLSIDEDSGMMLDTKG